MRLLYIGNALAKHGSTPTSADIVPSLLRKEGFNVLVTSHQKNTFLRMLDMLCTIIINSRSLDYVLIDTYSTKNFWYSYFCALLCKLFGLNYIPILHGGSLPQRMTQSPRMTKAIMANSFQNITPSHYLLEALNERGFNGQLIPNAITINKYIFKCRTQIQPHLLYVRAFSDLYNPQMALYVLKNLLTNFPDATLCMVGPDRDGTLEKCKELAKVLRIEEHVIFPGKLTKTEWHKLSESYDIFINTTNKDNTPVSVLEAMALGLPVVSTNPGGIPYLIDDGLNGLLVNVGDIDAMVKKISFLLQHHDYAFSIANSARLTVELFDWNKVKLQWKDLLANGKVIE